MGVGDVKIMVGQLPTIGQRRGVPFALPRCSGPILLFWAGARARVHWMRGMVDGCRRRPEDKFENEKRASEAALFELGRGGEPNIEKNRQRDLQKCRPSQYPSNFMLSTLIRHCHHARAFPSAATSLPTEGEKNIWKEFPGNPMS